MMHVFLSKRGIITLYHSLDCPALSYIISLFHPAASTPSLRHSFVAGKLQTETLIAIL
jgi:hypothetical protein